MYTDDLSTNLTGFTQENTFVDAPNYPTFFGVKVTPTIGGIAIAVLGLGLSGYAFTTYVSPQLQKNQEAAAKLSQTKEQVDARKNVAKEIVRAENDLKIANQKYDAVKALFADEPRLDTFLYDLNAEVRSRQGRLDEFKPVGVESRTIADGSFGAALNNRLKERTTDIKITGSFEQIQSILRAVERFDRLLVVKNFQADLTAKATKIYVDPNGKVVPPPPLKPGESPANSLTTTLQLQAVMPLSPAEVAALTPPASPQPAK